MNLENFKQSRIDRLGGKGSSNLSKRDLSAFNEQQQGFTDILMEDVVSKLRVLSIEIEHGDHLVQGVKRLNTRISEMSPPERKSSAGSDYFNKRLGGESPPPRKGSEQITSRPNLHKYNKIWVDKNYRRPTVCGIEEILENSGTQLKFLLKPAANVVIRYEKFDLEKWIQKVLLSYYYSCNRELNTVD